MTWLVEPVAAPGFSAAVAVPMHPLAGLSDHLHVVLDAKADVLIFDAQRFGARAAEIAEQVPKLKLIALGPSPIAQDLCELAARL